MSRLSDQQIAELEALAMPLIKWLNDNMHPHAKIIVDPTYYELTEGVATKYTTEFVKD